MLMTKKTLFAQDGAVAEEAECRPASRAQDFPPYDMLDEAPQSWAGTFANVFRAKIQRERQSVGECHMFNQKPIYHSTNVKAREVRAIAKQNVREADARTVKSVVPRFSHGQFPGFRPRALGLLSRNPASTRKHTKVPVRVNFTPWSQDQGSAQTVNPVSLASRGQSCPDLPVVDTALNERGYILAAYLNNQHVSDFIQSQNTENNRAFRNTEYNRASTPQCPQSQMLATNYNNSPLAQTSEDPIESHITPSHSNPLGQDLVGIELPLKPDTPIEVHPFLTHTPTTPHISKPPNRPSQYSEHYGKARPQQPFTDRAKAQSPERKTGATGAELSPSRPQSPRKSEDTSLMLSNLHPAPPLWPSVMDIMRLNIGGFKYHSTAGTDNSESKTNDIRRKEQTTKSSRKGSAGAIIVPSHTMDDCPLCGVYYSDDDFLDDNPPHQHNHETAASETCSPVDHDQSTKKLLTRRKTIVCSIRRPKSGASVMNRSPSVPDAAKTFLKTSNGQIMKFSYFKIS